MATTTKKKTTTISESTPVVETTEKDSVKEKKSAPAKKTVPTRKFTMDEYIDCQSVVYGPLYVMGVKSKIMYQWSDYGDVTPVMYGDLMSLYSMRDKSIMKPRIKILDEDLVKQWGNVLSDMYDGMQEADIETILNMPAKTMRGAIENAPDGIKLAIKTIAGRKIRDGEFDSLSKIKVIDEVLGTDLRMLAD